MRTTLDLPDDLMRTVKLRAASEGRKLKDVIAESLRRGLAEEAPSRPVRHRVALPLIKGGRRASKDQEMTPQRVAQLLTELDAGSVGASS